MVEKLATVEQFHTLLGRNRINTVGHNFMLLLQERRDTGADGNAVRPHVASLSRAGRGGEVTITSVTIWWRWLVDTGTIKLF